MAKNEVELDEQLEESGGGFTRFLFFVTPIIFLIVMLTVLMALFNMNFRDTLFDFGKQIPIVKNWIPDDGSPEAKKKEETKLQEKSSEATIKQLKEQLAKQESQLQEANSKAQEQSDQVKNRITSYNVCYTKLLRYLCWFRCREEYVDGHDCPQRNNFV